MTEAEKEIKEIENRLKELTLIKTLNSLISFFDQQKLNKRKVCSIFYDNEIKEFKVYFKNKEIEENDTTQD